MREDPKQWKVEANLLALMVGAVFPLIAVVALLVGKPEDEPKPAIRAASMTCWEHEHRMTFQNNEQELRYAVTRSRGVIVAITALPAGGGVEQCVPKDSMTILEASIPLNEQ